MTSTELDLGYQRFAGQVAGVDEAGRGPLAGPVVAAAVVLDPRRPIAGLDDSKRLSAAARERLAEEVRSRALMVAVAEASVSEIDSMNILQATLLAMQRAVQGLSGKVDHALIDGKVCPSLECTATPVVKGDATYAEIAAASILAKVTRDQVMARLDRLYPHYDFARHKGYPTREHVRRLHQHGASPVHRRSFAPVRRLAGNAPLATEPR